MNILCVDDSATLRKIISMTLTPLGHTVIEAENGRKALEQLAASAVDCVILDINMPEMGGIEFLKEKGLNPAFARVPVVVLTTQDEEELKSTAMSLGANGFLAKPFQKDELLATLHQILGD